MKLLGIILLFVLSSIVDATDYTCPLRPGDYCTISIQGGSTPPSPPGVPPSTTPPPTTPPTDPGTVYPGTKPACATNYTFLNWSGTAIERRGQSGAFAPNGVWVIEFRTPLTFSNTSLPRISAAETGSSPSGRIAVLSPVPCDFSGTALGYGSTSQSNSPNLAFGIGNKPNWYTAAVPLASVIYFNIKNNADASCASTGVCDMFVDLVIPSSAVRTKMKSK